MALPLGMLRSLKMGCADKLGLAAVFLISFAIIVIDIVRYISHDYVSRAWCISVEPGMAVIVCALPIYRHMLRAKRPGSHTIQEIWARLGWNAGWAQRRNRTAILQLPASRGALQLQTSEKAQPAAVYAPSLKTPNRKSDASLRKLVNDQAKPSESIASNTAAGVTCSKSTSIISTDSALNYGIRHQSEAD